MFSPGSNFYGKFKVLKTKISDITRVKFVTKNLSEQFYLVYAQKLGNIDYFCWSILRFQDKISVL